MGLGRKVSSNVPIVAGLQLQTSCWGRPIPVIYGQTRVAGNMIWQNDFKAIGNNSSAGGKGGGSSTSYTYQTAIMLAIGEGPINAVLNTWDGKAVHGPGEASWLDEYGNLIASGDPLLDLGFSFFVGAQGQGTWSYTLANHPTQARGYSNLAYLAASVYQLGPDASLPNNNFEVQAILHGTTGVGGVPDAAPDQVLYDMLTNLQYGAGFAASKIASLTAMQTYCRAAGIWISPCYADVRTGAEIVDELAQICNCAFFFSEGLFKVVPYGDQAITANGVTYTPVSTIEYALTDDDFIEVAGDPVIVTRAPPAMAYNCIQVMFLDRTNQYNNNIAEKKDDVGVATNGLRVQPELDFPEIADPNVAHMVAQLILQRSMYLRNTYKFRIGMRFLLLEPGDLLSLTESTGTGLTAQPVRITSVVENEDNTIDIEAEDWLGTVSSAPLYGYQKPGGYAVNYNAAPGSVIAPVIFDAPARLTKAGYEIWIAATGDPTQWGGATCWMSLDGASYRIAGVIEGRARYGVTEIAALGIGTDPDTSDTLYVDLTNSSASIAPGVQADADSLQTLCIVDSEVIAYTGAALTSQYHYTLGSYIRRGLLGSQRVQHQIGAPFVRLDSGIFTVPYDPQLVGKTVYFKFTSWNIWDGGEQGLAGVTAYPYTINGPIGVPLAAPAGGWTSYGLTQMFGTTVFKSLAAALAWDTAIFSRQAYVNGCFVSASFVGVNGDCMIGLTQNPGNPGYANIDFGIRCDNGSLFIFESGGQISIPSLLFGTYVDADTVKVLYDGRTIRYYHGTTLLRSTQEPGLALYAQISLNAPGTALNGIDFGSTVSSPFEAGNFMSNLVWEVGTFGSQGHYLDYFDGAHNDSSIVLTQIGPSNSSEPIWQCVGNGAAQNGGWTNFGDLQGIDPTKTYRMTCWVQRQGPAAGNFTFGVDVTLGGTSDIGGGVDFSNAAFLNIALSTFNAYEWYLAVGIIHGSGYNGADEGVSGLYRQLDGSTHVAASEYRQTANHTYQSSRAWLSGANNPATVLLLARPRFEEINGNEPTLLSLIGLAGTELISQNGATVVYQLYNPGAGVEGFASTAMENKGGGLMIADGSLPNFDCTVIITYVFTAYITTLSSGGVKLGLSYTDDAQLAWDALTQLSGAFIPLTTTPTVFTLQWQFEHLAANSATGATSSPWGQTTDISNQISIGSATIQLEYIKR